MAFNIEEFKENALYHGGARRNLFNVKIENYKISEFRIFRVIYGQNGIYSFSMLEDEDMKSLDMLKDIADKKFVMELNTFSKTGNITYTDKGTYRLLHYETTYDWEKIKLVNFLVHVKKEEE